MGKKLLLIGGGGHCKSVIDSVLAMKAYDEIGIIDSTVCPFQGIPVVGTDEDLPKLYLKGWTDAFITVGSIGNTGTRRRLFQTVKEIGFSLPVIMDPSAVTGIAVKIGEGTFVGKRAVINAGTTLGMCTIINTGALIEHDCEIGDFTHISTGAILCGQVRVGSDTHVGAGSTVRQGICIGNDTLIGAGSIVVKDLPSDVKAYGNPCRVISV